MTAEIILGGSLFLIGLLFFALSERNKRLAFEERFPPISDAEFVARCAPGTDTEVALGVRRILSEALGVDYERIYPSSRLIQDLGCE